MVKTARQGGSLEVARRKFGGRHGEDCEARRKFGGGKEVLLGWEV